MTADDDGVVTRLTLRLRADPARVLARPFVPGHELIVNTESRAHDVLARVLAIPEDQVAAILRDIGARFGHRHRDLPGVLAAHYERIAHRVPDADALSAERRTLIGAWFTQEYAVEAAALFNPSVVPHPDQSGLPQGHVRFVLSLRAVGEGHISSVEFREGVFDGAGSVTLDDPGRHVEAGRVGPAVHDRQLLAALLADGGADVESMSYLVGHLPGRFDGSDLERSCRALAAQGSRHGGSRTIELARAVADSEYEVEFPPDSALGERVLWPHGPTEAAGMEDARFVRFTDDDGRVTFRATYTAFDGRRIAPQLIETADFRRFRIGRLAGPAARNKGMALFPRPIGGKRFALSRWDRENNSVATSTDGYHWTDAQTVPVPDRWWALTQTGNCGSPLETEAGWLVLTHGVGPMREYVLGALLLDRDDPRRLLAALPEPLMTPLEEERDGYVPNVLYSCGGLLHGNRLLLPYGASDSSVRFAVIDVPRLLDRLVSTSPR